MNMAFCWPCENKIFFLFQDNQAHRDHRVKGVNLARQDLLVSQDHLEDLESVESLVQLDLRALEELQDSEENLDLLDLQDQQAKGVNLVKEDKMDHLDLLAPVVQVDHVAHLDKGESLELKAEQVHILHFVQQASRLGSCFLPSKLI